LELKNLPFNAILTVISTVIIIFVVIVGATLVNPQNWEDFAPFGIAGIFEGAGIVFFSYVGFDMVANFAEEAQNPQRDFPISIISSLIIASILYVAVALVVTGITPYYELDTRAPLAAAFRDNGVLWAEIVIAIGAFVSMVPLVSLPATSRILFSMSRDGLLPEFLSITSDNGNPWVSQLFAGVLCTCLTLFLDVRTLSELVSIGTLSAFTFVNACVLLLRSREIREDDDQRAQSASWMITYLVLFILGVALLAVTTRVVDVPWLSALFLLLLIVPGGLVFQHFLQYPDVNVQVQTFRTPLVPLVPLLGILVNIYIMCSLAPITWIVFAGWLLAGAVIYFIYGYRHSAARGSISEEQPLFKA